MEQQKEQLQFCNISFKDLLNHAKLCKIKIVGIIKSVFSTKKYIIELMINQDVVVRSIRKFNQFQATYDVIKMKFQNFDLGVFPSKFQVFNKDETRKQYFQWSINKIIQNYNQMPDKQANKRLLSIVFLFLTRTISHNEQSIIKKKGSEFGSEDSEIVRKRKKSLSDIYIKKNSPVFSKSVQSSQSKPFGVTQYQIERNRTRRNSQGSVLQVSQFNNDYQKHQTTYKKDSRINLSIQLSTQSQFEIKFETQQRWKKRYLQIKNSSLLIFKDKMENNFRTAIELFRIKVEYLHREKNLFDHFCQKMEISNQPTFQLNQSIVTISHQYDYRKLMIKGISLSDQMKQSFSQESIREYQQKQLRKLKQFKQYLQTASQISPIQDKFEGVFNPIGKIFLVIHKVTLLDFKENKKDILKVKVRTTNLQFQCKKILLKEQNVIKQGFFIPISNTFETIQIDVQVSREQGWIRQQFKNLPLGYYPIEFSEILTKPQGQKFQKITVVLNKPLEPLVQKYNSTTKLEYSLQNYSHFSSIYSQSFANQNDGKIISGLKLEDMSQLSVTVDRALRIIGNIALLITAFWRNVYLFKYPRLSRYFFTLVLMLFIFGSAKHLFTILFVLIIFLICYHHPRLQPVIKLCLDYFFFCYLHPDFIPPLSLGSSQIKYRKWCLAFQDISKQFKCGKQNRLQKRDDTHKVNFLQYRFQVHGRVFVVVEEVKGFLGKMFQGKKIIQIVSRMISGVVNTLEKAANLFCWIDGKRTLFLLILIVVFSGVASDFLFRFIGIVFCIHRLYKGMNFYSFKHYARNKKIAILTLRYLLNKHFSHLIPSTTIFDLKKCELFTKDLQLLESTICKIKFPLSDENQLKKLNNQLNKLISIYIDLDSLKQYKSEQEQIIKQAQKQNLTNKQKHSFICLANVVRFIETCQTRLQLEWVSGKQGLSNEFQQLKDLTRETPLIDVWLQHLIINFVCNIPSQMFVRLKKQADKRND